MNIITYNSKTAGAKIRALRERNGLSREQLAELAGISAKFLYDIEVRNKNFSARTLAGLATSLNVSCDYILLGEIKCGNQEEISHILQNFSNETFSDVAQIIHIIYNISMR